MNRPGHASRLAELLRGRMPADRDGDVYLTPIDAIDAIEEAMRLGESEHGDRWRTRTVLHHVKKSIGHALSAGPHGNHIDHDSGHPHLVLAATRMVLAVAVSFQPREPQ